MAIIVAGASGDLGRRVAQCLLEAVPAREVILVSRNPAALTEFSRRGVQVRAGDFDKPESLKEVFGGGEKLLLISTLDIGERRRRQHQLAIESAVAAGVRHIVYTSSVGIHPHNPCFVIPDHRETERVLAGSGIAFTILRMSS